MGIPQAGREEVGKNPVSLKPNALSSLLLKSSVRNQCTCGFDRKRLHTVIFFYKLID